MAITVGAKSDMKALLPSVILNAVKNLRCAFYLCGQPSAL